MEKLTNNNSSTRTVAQVLLAALTACMLVLAIAPGAQAQTRDTKTADTAVQATTSGCPDGWVVSSAPGGCAPGYLTIEIATFDFDNGCPDGWVPTSAPGGCAPGFLTLKLAGLEFDNGCPDGWVVSSAPGGCSPGFFTIDAGERVLEAEFHCAFGSACDDMIEAVKALGGECGSSVFGETCTLPTGPEGRD